MSKAEAIVAPLIAWVESHEAELAELEIQLDQARVENEALKCTIEPLMARIEVLEIMIANPGAQPHNIVERGRN